MTKLCKDTVLKSLTKLVVTILIATSMLLLMFHFLNMLKSTKMSDVTIKILANPFNVCTVRRECAKLFRVSIENKWAQWAETIVERKYNCNIQIISSQFTD